MTLLLFIISKHNPVVKTFMVKIPPIETLKLYFWI